MFTLKKIIGLMIEPLSLSLILLAVGLLMAYRQRAWLAKLGNVACWLGLGVLYLASTDAISDALLLPLERKFPAWQATAEDPERAPELIVVLGGGHRSDDALPLTSQLKAFSLARLSEGVRIWHRYPQSTLVLSGFAGSDKTSNAEMMRRLALELGVAPQQIITEPRPKDTAEEARLIAPLIKDKRAVLVTSGYHMPRAVALFNKQGAFPLPAPTEHKAHAPEAGFFSVGRWVPTASDLVKSTRAVHEYAGLAWARLNRQVD